MDLSANAKAVLERRYLRKEAGKPVETPEEMLQRVAQHIAAIEGTAFNTPESEISEITTAFFEIMDRKKFMPNSPTLMNAGRDLGQLSACFVLPIDDSMESIFESLKIAALIHKSGGGTGFSFSQIRPKNDQVGSTGGVASGPLSFLRVFNASTEAVKQGGTRRGANMGILRVDHPDIIEFIEAKKIKGEIANFNLSVALTDSFMEALEKGEDYYLVNPRTKQPMGKLSAREVFEKIVLSAWAGGEPGIIFIDRMNEANPTPNIAAIESTNPCLTGDTWVLTGDGPAQIRDILGRHTYLALNGAFHQSDKKGFFKTGTKKVIKLNTDRGYELTMTRDHLVRVAVKITRYGIKEEWKAAGELNPKDKLILSNNRGIKWEGKGCFNEGLLLGFLIGDGTLKDEGGVICIWGDNEEAQSLMKAVGEAAHTLPHRSDFKGFQTMIGARKENRMRIAALRDLAAKYNIVPGKKKITNDIEKSSYEFYRGFLRGLFDTDGTVVGDHNRGLSVRLWQNDLECLKRVQRMLLRLGIASTVYQNRKNEEIKSMPDGKGGYKDYPVKSGHELVITQDNLLAFSEIIGFSSVKKQNRLTEGLESYKRALNRERFVATITSIVGAGEEEVYDVQVPGINAFDANGIYVHNCGEQPLLPYESCNLGSLNLAVMVKRNEDGKYEIDWEELGRVTRLSVRFLDDVIEANRFPISQIEKMTKSNRKIGLGVMGWADLLIKLRISYQSEEAIKLAEEIFQFIDEESKKASVDLAKTRGTFPNFKGSIYDCKGGLKLRNATTTTIAPTGTISIICDTSGGVEPLFSLAFTRQIMDNDRLIEVNHTFEEIAKEEGFYSPELMNRIAENGGIHGIEEIPEDLRPVLITAHDIVPEWHIRMQAAFQKYTDNAVSKTINFPSDATPDQVAEAYHLAFKLGCKGLTVYRDGSLDNQPMQKGVDKKAAEPQEHTDGSSETHLSYGEWGKILPIKRPKRLVGVTDGRLTPEGNLYLTLNFHEKHPFELFAQIGKAGSDISAFTEAIARLISLAFRCGIDPEAVADELLGIGGSRFVGFGPNRVRSVPDAIGQFLNENINKMTESENENDESSQLELGLAESESAPVSNTQPETEHGHNGNGKNGKNGKVRYNLCPVCGMHTFGFVEGCAKCVSCGHSEC